MMLTTTDYDECFDLMLGAFKYKEKPSRIIYTSFWKKHDYTVKDLKDIIFKMAGEFTWFPAVAEIHTEMKAIWNLRKLNNKMDDLQVDPDGQRKLRAILETIFIDSSEKKYT